MSDSKDNDKIWSNFEYVLHTVGNGTITVRVNAKEWMFSQCQIGETGNKKGRKTNSADGESVLTLALLKVVNGHSPICY